MEIYGYITSFDFLSLGKRVKKEAINVPQKKTRKIEGSKMTPLVGRGKTWNCASVQNNPSFPAFPLH